jgi:malonate-semialdehyde dehydrogenase (acetylating)/methylmalonate-semialdehyde dehydrogenase
VNAGFGSAGERCMAISALVAVEPIADDLILKTRDWMGKPGTGDGTRGCDMGPLITGQHRDKVTSYVDAGVEEGAELVVNGRNTTVDADGEGFFLEPTLFDKVTPEMSIYANEIFGPVLSVVRTSSYVEGLELINANPYGNGTEIFTNDGGAARIFQSEVEVGMVGGQRADPGAGVLLLVRRLEEQPLRGQPRARHRGCPLLHPRQGRHLPLARPQPRQPQPRLPQND